MTIKWSAEGRFLLWSATQTGCQFAKLIGTREQLRQVVTVERTDDLAASIELVSASAKLASLTKVVLVVVLPAFDSPEAIRGLLTELDKRDEWRVRPVDGHDGQAVGLEWIAGPATSTAMGFGPFHTMPEVRRSPMSALVVYTGASTIRFDRRSGHAVS